MILRFKPALVLAVAALAACSGGSSSTPAAAPLFASATNIQFGTDYFPAPQVVTLSSQTGVSGNGASSVSITDPTIVGAYLSAVSPTTETLTLIPIAQGLTTVTARDGQGQTVTVTTQSSACGRPDSLTSYSQLIYPATKSTGVATSIGTLYFVTYSKTILTTVKLHLVVGQTQSLEGGTLAPAAPPPQAVIPAAPPVAGLIAAYWSATIPPLPASSTIRTQLYDDACQPAVIVGTIST